jgi:type VI secretion system (T6SS) effector TldE1-like protein
LGAPGVGFGDLMVSDAARAKKLLSRRRVGRSETILLSVAAVSLSLGAAAWVADVNATAPYVSAALPPAGITTSFNERFQPLSGDQPAPESGLRPLDRSAVSVLQLKLRDAKALLAQQLLYDDWRAASLAGEEKPAADDAKPSQKADVPLPRSRPTQADLAAQIASSQAFADSLPKADNRTLLQKFSDFFPGKIRLASLTPDSGLFRQGPDLAALGYASQTAVYDISAKAVYLPSGVALEAHSGMGALMDDPDHVDQRMVGATPPATYELKPREKLFHGVRALRLTPVDGTSALGRVGLLTHSFMLGPRGDSNGCVSIKFYDRFLKAYDDGEINRLIVVPSLKGAAPASQRTASSDS